MEEDLGGTAMSIDFSGISLPFAATDLLSSGVGLLGVVGGFVLLALAFPMVMKLIAVIKRSFGQSNRA
jgi:hypothetical protein